MSEFRRRMMMKAKEQQSSVEDLDYFTVVPESSEGVTIHFRRPAVYYYDIDNDVDINYNAPYYYRMNEGSWVKVEGVVTENVLIEPDSLFIPYGSKMQIKCYLVEYASSIGVYDSAYYPEIKNDEGEGMFSVEGTPMSLIYGEPQREFKGLSSETMLRFEECFGLTRINNPKSFLPSTVLIWSCYRSMFKKCPNLVNSPELPATTLADGCYNEMFDGCTSLVNAPELPATTLADGCYNEMFDGCTSLVNAPELPATTLADSCYGSMFYGCTNLNYIKMLATDISAYYCLENWAKGVAPTGTFVKSKDATWDVVGDSGVPTGWTVITDEQESGGEITFYVNDVAYTALDGMTWGEYINSDYNGNVVDNFGTPYKNFTVDKEGYIKSAILDEGFFDTYMMIHTGGWAPIYTSEQIINNQKYIAD